MIPYFISRGEERQLYECGGRRKVLIVDNSEMNRAILTDMLCDQYEIIEASDGAMAVKILQESSGDISLVLLDIVMPGLDGLDILAIMNRYHWIEEIPVIMISAENSHSIVNRAYELGAADYISRPFDEVIVRRRVINTIMLYSKQKRLFSMVAEQMYESEKSSTLMVSILSHIVEFRNGESGLHVLHIGTMTELLLRRLSKKTDAYSLDLSRISVISKAAAFHDIGKIAIPEEILNKPGRLTPEEFERIKTHSAIGADMLSNLPLHKEEPLVKVAYEICRWHHERYDGNGYPDGLKGEEIPISAQVVSLADAYDALISERVYKPAYSHAKAVEMILNGECCCFNPLLLECLADIKDRIEEELTVNSPGRSTEKEMRKIVERMLSSKELSTSSRALSLLEEEQEKFRFFAATTDEIQFEYTANPPMLTLSDRGGQRLGLPRMIMNPAKNPELWSVISREDVCSIDRALRAAEPDEPASEYSADLKIDGTVYRCKIVFRSLWTSDAPKQYRGFLGKIPDIRQEEQPPFSGSRH